MSHIAKARRALAKIEAEGLETLPWAVHVEYGVVILNVSAERLTAEELRMVKRSFGPFKAEQGYNGQNLVGTVIVDPEFRITVRIDRAYACKQLEPNEITEEKWLDIKAKVREGLVKIQDCTPVETKAEA